MTNQKDKKLTKNDITKIKKEIDDIRASTIGGYRLRETLINNIDKLFSINGFNKLVRQWHMSYIPELAASGNITMINCPYCLNNVTLRSCRIDHVIPWKIYVRYQIYLKAIEMAKQYLSQFDDVGENINNQMTGKGQRFKIKGVLPEHIIKVQGIGDIINFYFNDRTNMLLCCNACNALKSDKIVPLYRLRAAEKKASDIKNTNAAEKINNIKNTLTSIHNIEAKYLNFIIEGVFSAGVSIGQPPLINYFESSNESQDKIKTTLAGMLKKVRGISPPSQHQDTNRIKFLGIPAFQQAAQINGKRRIQYDIETNEDTDDINKFMDIYIEQANRIFDNYRRASLDYKGTIKNKSAAKNDKTSSVIKNTAPATKDNKRDAAIATMFVDKNKILEDSHIKYELMNHQVLSKQDVNFKGKLCFYCLGIYEPFCFELDHINSALKNSPPSTSREDKKANYNKIENIIPVCKICNAKKGTTTLDKKLLTSFLTQRRAEKGFHFGVEHTANYTLDKVNKIRMDLLLPKRTRR